MNVLLKIATMLRAGQLYAHHAHNNVKGSTFFTDHSFFGELYPTYETAYDGCIERYMGTGDCKADTIAVSKEAIDLIEDFPKEGGEGNRAFYQALLRFESTLCSMCEKAVTLPMSEGTKQMVGNLADESEVRQYKMKQRLKP